MAERVPTRLTAAEGRRFGLTVGGAFVVLAMVAWWRGHPTTSAGLGALGLSLVCAGLAWPSRLSPVERAWMALAQAISRVTTPIVMGIMYLVVITPIGVARRMAGARPLVHEEAGEGFWKPRPVRRSNMRRQF